MSHFYSRIQGTKGPATRCGDKRNGIHAEVMSWRHKLVTVLYHDHEVGVDCASIYIDGRALFDGPLEELASAPQDVLVHGMAHMELDHNTI
jgi:hypothetical protein